MAFKSRTWAKLMETLPENDDQSLPPPSKLPQTNSQSNSRTPFYGIRSVKPINLLFKDGLKQGLDILSRLDDLLAITPNLVPKYKMEDCLDKGCPLRRDLYPEKRAFFEQQVVSSLTRNFFTKSSAEFTYTTLGSGLLKQDYLLLSQAFSLSFSSKTENPTQNLRLRVNIIDDLYSILAGDDLTTDEQRIRDSVLDFAISLRELCHKFNVKLESLFSYASADLYLQTKLKSDVLLMTDLSPNQVLDTAFRTIVSKVLTPTGRWYLLYKYKNGGPSSLSPALPREVFEIFKTRGEKTFTCLIFGHQSSQKRTRIFDLDYTQFPHRWFYFPTNHDHIQLNGAERVMVEYEIWEKSQRDNKIEKPSSQLSLAVLSKQYLWTRLLLKSGEKIVSDEYGRTPLHFAVVSPGNPDIVEAQIVSLLIRFSANVNAVAKESKPFSSDNIEANSPLHWVSQTGALLSAKQLISLGASVNLPNSHGNTPLHFAALNSFPEICLLFKQNGADVSFKNLAGLTPLDLALSKNLPQVLSVLNS